MSDAQLGSTCASRNPKYIKIIIYMLDEGLSREKGGRGEEERREDEKGGRRRRGRKMRRRVEVDSLKGEWGGGGGRPPFPSSHPL